jgi:hypothetical protein
MYGVCHQETYDLYYVTLGIYGSLLVPFAKLKKRKTRFYFVFQTTY